jgi:hypothetical protein
MTGYLRKFLGAVDGSENLIFRGFDSKFLTGFRPNTEDFAIFVTKNSVAAAKDCGGVYLSENLGKII